MSRVDAIEVPTDSLLGAHARGGAFVDAYAVEIARAVDLARFVSAFYSTPLFRIERALLAVLARRPSTDDDLRRLAAGASDRFAAWQVEARRADQLLLAAGRTRSWLCVVPDEHGTRLLFGSAVLPARDGRMGALFGALLGFHRLYSRALLAAAWRALQRESAQATA
jgi:hypothetical protein